MASSTLASLVPLPPTQEALDSEFKPIQLFEGRVDPLMVGVWPRKLKAREAIAYFQYSDANGGRLATAANAGAYGRVFSRMLRNPWRRDRLDNPSA